MLLLKYIYALPNNKLANLLATDWSFCY